MRRNPTESERQMWLILKDRRLADYKFRRQVPIGPYIADFVCYSARLIIELDGSQHDEGSDAARNAWLQSKGFRVLRVWNTQLTSERDAVLDAVWHNLTEMQHG
jgi:very-short-patch-repair endonuclease